MSILLSLPFLVFLPLVVSILILSPLFTSNEVVLRRFSKGIFGFHFVYVLLMLLFFNPSNPYAVDINLFGMDWIQSMGIKFSLKTDAVSMILVTLTSFIFLMAAVSSKFNIRKNHKFYYSMLFLLEFAVLGIFTASDMFLFFLFWELEMFPAYFLIGGKWGK
jgi:NADH-quinone oxidoreductase subunit M